MDENILRRRASLNSDVIAFVHAKGTSERVPGKNMRLLGHKPLFCHAILNALNSRLVTKVVIDSESDEILAIGEKYGAIPLKRPAELATNRTTGDDLAYWQASNYPNAEIVLQVIPTSPFLRSSSIDRAINMILEMGVDSVVGVFAEVLYKWAGGKPTYFRADGSIPNSAEMSPVVYETTGLYVNRTSFVLVNKRRMNANSCVPLYLSRIEAIDINTVEDFEFALVVWKGLRS
jgi:CMP-N-acetylneuraminic acid synthetase